jgi:hypothetical protein
MRELLAEMVGGLRDDQGRQRRRRCVVIPRELVVEEDGTIPRSNPCGGHFWNGYAVVSCEAQAPPGLARCRRCFESEKAEKERKARERAEKLEAEKAPKRRRKAS